jgi:hypothetical protein
MPTVTLQNYPYSDSAASNAESVMKDLYNPDVSNVSFEAINGGLDVTNADSWTVKREQVQEGTFTTAGAVAGTANIDWFASEWFGQEVSNSAGITLPSGIPVDAFQMIPGANQTFYLPWASTVVFTWTMLWGGELWHENFAAHMVFVLDGVYDPADAANRAAPRSMWRVNAAANTYGHWGEVKNRHWHGHTTKTLAAGWHTAGIGLVCHAQTRSTSEPLKQKSTVQLKGWPLIRQVRVWARSFRHIAFRNSG